MSILKLTKRSNINQEIRIVYIISTMHPRWIAIEWVSKHLERSKFNLSFILIANGDHSLASFLKAQELPFLPIHHSGLQDLPRTILIIYNYLREHNIEIVHTHFGIACRAGLVAAVLARVPVRIHTRHYGGLHENNAKLWVWVWARINNLCSNKIIAPSNVVKSVLCDGEGVQPNQIVRIDHGFDLQFYASAIRDLASRHYSSEDAPIVGVVARYELLKGIQFIIPAFRRLLQDYPNAKLVLAGAFGSYIHEICKLLSNMLPEHSYTEIKFELDQVALYKRFDIFVHVPIVANYEAFGQVYVEALAAGVPSVFTPSGIAAEFIVDRYNAHLVPFQDSDAIYRSIKFILSNPEHREQLIINGLDSVRARFGLDLMISSLEELYIHEIREFSK